MLKKEFSVDGKMIVLEELEYLIKRALNNENYIPLLDVGLSGYSRAIFEIAENVRKFSEIQKKCDGCYYHSPQGTLTQCQKCIKDFLGND